MSQAPSSCWALNSFQSGKTFRHKGDPNLSKMVYKGVRIGSRGGAYPHKTLRSRLPRPLGEDFLLRVSMGFMPEFSLSSQLHSFLLAPRQQSPCWYSLWITEICPYKREANPVFQQNNQTNKKNQLSSPVFLYWIQLNVLQSSKTIQLSFLYRGNCRPFISAYHAVNLPSFPSSCVHWFCPTHQSNCEEALPQVYFLYWQLCWHL